ncbi:hypothetical protein B0H11DRAFT_199713 [Mycena galericulata]|nr:hypothetical protein B0H11DRAFT_199713 [Mycena galericulata]
MADVFRLFDVPDELLIYILGFLPHDALDACQQSSRFLSNVINSSVELQYLRALDVAQLTENPTTTTPIVDRLAALRARETAFFEVKPSWKRSIPVSFLPAGLYELSAGLFFLGESSRNALRYIKLPSEPDRAGVPPIEWERIAVSSPTVIIDFGLAIEEHDLIVLATLYVWVSQDKESISTLFPISTPTPLQVYVPGLPREGVIKLEFLAMSTHQPHPQARGPIEVQTSHWDLPNIILEIVGDHVVFVVAYAHAGLHGPNDTVYIYQWRTGKLVKQIIGGQRTYFGAVFLTPDVLMLPNTVAASLELWRICSEELTPVLTLHLPRVMPGVRIQLMTARGEPNPSASRLRKDARVPFSTSAEDSIIVFHVNFPGQRFLLFIHRRALLVVLAAHPEPGDTVGYAQWGPDACRWLNAAGMIMDWITTTSGQRCVLLPRQTPAPFILLDFNANNSERSGRRLKPQDDPFTMDHGIWAEAVGTRLPCHVAGSALQYSGYDGASLDDERIIALRRNNAHQVTAVDVFYFG